MGTYLSGRPLPRRPLHVPAARRDTDTPACLTVAGRGKGWSGSDQLPSHLPCAVNGHRHSATGTGTGAALRCTRHSCAATSRIHMHRSALLTGRLSPQPPFLCPLRSCHSSATLSHRPAPTCTARVLCADTGWPVLCAAALEVGVDVTRFVHTASTTTFCHYCILFLLSCTHNRSEGRSRRGRWTDGFTPRVYGHNTMTTVGLGNRHQ